MLRPTVVLGALCGGDEGGQRLSVVAAGVRPTSRGSRRSRWTAGRRVQDFSRVVDYLVTLPYVDADRIGVLGVCGGGGYTLAAAKTEKRFKAVVSVTGANFGQLQREMAGQNGSVAQAMAATGDQRTAEAAQRLWGGTHSTWRRNFWTNRCSS